MMTRETIAGLVVSCSFVTLVGVVVFVKMKEGDPLARQADRQAAADGVPPLDPVPLPGAGQGGGTQARNEAPIVDPQVRQAGGPTGRNGVRPAPTTSIAPLPPATTPAPAAGGLNLDLNFTRNNDLGSQGLGGNSAHPASKEEPFVGPPVPDGLTREETPVAAPAGLPAHPTLVEIPFVGPPVPPELARELAGETTSGPGKQQVDPLFGPLPAAAPASPTPTPVTAAPAVVTPAPTDPGAQLRAPVIQPAAPGGPSGPGAALRGPISPAPAADDAPQANSRPRVAPIPPPSELLGTGAGAAQQPAPIPPLGTQPSAVSPPIPAPSPGGIVQASASGGAVVDSFDEEAYVCRSGDTFRSISEQYYRSPRYERALLLFNRDHPRSGESIRQEPPVLTPGQPIFLPPARILEKQYPAAITEGTPLPSAPAAPPPPSPGSVGLEAPRPVAGATPSTSWSMPASGPTYRVRKGGETFLDIARRTLGNSERWADVYRLNRNYNPAYPVSEGSVLVLPAGAHVEAEDRPQ